MPDLGKGPFKIIDLMPPDDARMPDDLVVENTSKCEHCGANLLWRVIIEKPDGTLAVVGVTCAGKLNLDKIDISNRMTKKNKELVSNAVTGKGGNEFREWAKKQPHPMGWKYKSLLDDIWWWFNKKPKGYTSRINSIIYWFNTGDRSKFDALLQRQQTKRSDKQQAEIVKKAKEAMWERQFARDDLMSKYYDLQSYIKHTLKKGKVEKAAKIEAQLQKLKDDFLDEWGVPFKLANKIPTEDAVQRFLELNSIEDLAP